MEDPEMMKMIILGAILVMATAVAILITIEKLRDRRAKIEKEYKRILKEVKKCRRS